MRDGPLWAITSYYNPIGYHRRSVNYRRFRQSLETPLLTVELSFQDRFELGEDEADRMIQLQGGDVMWQKERLLNLALEALPDRCQFVAWLDCDLIFPKRGWADRAMGLLREFQMIQPFRRVKYLDRNWRVGEIPAEHVERKRLSLASGVTAERPADICMEQSSATARMSPYANGIAWVGRRSLLSQHGFYDARILGGGDRALACAAYGCFEAMISRHELNARQSQHYLEWAKPFHQSVRGNVSHLNETVYHLWHGDVANRELGSRQTVLRDCEFDPFVDIARAEIGCWRWNTGKPNLHRRVGDYFDARKEDG
jgi:hypothetical protein